MANRRKRIAFLLGQAEEYHQKLFTQGFLREAFKMDCDVLIFSMFIKYQNTPARELGDSSIFSLIDYQGFDAVVVLADTIQTPGAVAQIEEDIHKSFSGPVLFVDKESKYFKSVLIDNYYPIKKLINHLIEDHGMKDIAFLTGKSWHPHSISRMEAFKDCMEEHGLPAPENRLFYGDFWYTSGESLADRLISSGKKLPEAIVCANDCMALGVAKVFANNGYSIPEDIAVIGYDSNEEGQHAPVPLTSAFIPSEEFGVYSANAIACMMEGKEIPEFVSDAKLFMGCSCGCEGKSTVPTYFKRDRWDTETSEGSVFSLFNYIDDDIIDQSSTTGLISTFFSYLYLIKNDNFSEFSLCLNEDWEHTRPRKDLGSRAFTDKISEVIIYGRNSNSADKVSFDTVFDRKEMVHCHEDRDDIPTAYFILPLYFDDRVYGYAVAGITDWRSGVSSEYRGYLRSVMRGLELYRRNDTEIKGDQILENNMYRDRLTGLYTYQGFKKQAPTLFSLVKNNGNNIGVLAIDIKDLSKINETYGREKGDKAIIAIASILDRVFKGNNGFTFCLGNGEMIAMHITSIPGDDDIRRLKDEVVNELNIYNENSEDEYGLEIYSGYISSAPEDTVELERLVGLAVSHKNGNKLQLQKLHYEENLSEEEKEEADKVRDVLDDNRLSYHFQPIVRATDGSIYGYEALMRAEITPYMTPPEIIRYADFFDRLYDVERATFNNVVKIVMDRKDIFDGSKKVFINSIPSSRIKDEDFDMLFEANKLLDDTIVVEMTEQTEISDNELDNMKKELNHHNVKFALDDYGTGFSNVSNLLRYMPNYVKIDRMLLSDIQDSPQKQHFVKDIITFAHDNNIYALAEGIETSEELKTVIDLGADLIQGYYTSRPSGEIISAIPEKIRKEIVEYKTNVLEEMFDKDKKKKDDTVYEAGREDKIILASLLSKNIGTIKIGNPEVVYINQQMVGTPGVRVPVKTVITNGYKGQIVLNNIDIGTGRLSDFPIIVEDGCDVTFVIVGHNMINGGIKVEEGARVTFEGDGILEFTGGTDEYTAIGNDHESSNGEIVIDCTGVIRIAFNGMNGVGIGSGNGGSVRIRRGTVKMMMVGKSCVGIGSIRGNSFVEIVNAAVEVEIKARNSVCVGSTEAGKNLLLIRNSVFKFTESGKELCVIGSTGEGKTIISLDNVDLTAHIEGFSGIIAGNRNSTAEVKISDSYFRGEMNCSLGDTIMADKSNFVSYNNSFTIRKDKES